MAVTINRFYYAYAYSPRIRASGRLVFFAKSGLA